MKTELTHKSILLAGAVLVGAVPNILKLGGVTLGVQEVTVPLNWLGDVLRELSLSGHGGNAVAWCVVFGVCMLPFLVSLWAKKYGGGCQREDGLLLLMIPELFALLYFLVNPTHLGGIEAGRELNRAMFGLAACGTVLSTLLAWLVLRGLRNLNEANMESLAEIFRKLLVLCAFLLTSGSVYQCLSGLSRQIAEIEAANSGDITFTVRVLMLLSVLRLLPELWAADTLLWSSKLAKELGRATFDTQTVQLCQQTAEACKRVVRNTMLTTVVVNLIQLVLAGQLHDSNFTVEFPLFVLALSSGLFLLCRCLQRGQELQVDVESII